MPLAPFPFPLPLPLLSRYMTPDVAPPGVVVLATSFGANFPAPLAPSTTLIAPPDPTLSANALSSPPPTDISLKNRPSAGSSSSGPAYIIDVHRFE
ncbi:hypothetical protein FRC12_014271 [Ceratobasidium sp. 428]|nr:hypothetical protein FRC12_014271 [Ceratobasidium sp. 428]